MVKNRFGIAEPCPRFAAQRRNRLPAWALDTLIVPLVGFDQQANRMGMGADFMTAAWRLCVDLGQPPH